MLKILNYAHSLSKESSPWEEEDFHLSHIGNNTTIPITTEEIDLIKECLEEVKPIKLERIHEITINRAICYDTGGGYEIIKVELLPVTCENCGKDLSEIVADELQKAGITPHCSQYCFEQWNGNFNISDFTAPLGV